MSTHDDASAVGLFDPLSLRRVEFANRVFVSPMCQYSAGADGLPDSWHLVHLGSFGLGGAGLVMTEATAVSPVGRLSPFDTGIWSAAHVAAWTPIVDFLHRNGCPVGMQIVHAGRKGSTSPPWDGEQAVLPPDGGWRTVGPTAEPFGDLPAPDALSEPEVAAIVDEFAIAARNARRAGFDVVEIHAAHGYLLHQFYSKTVNSRTDSYGGSFEGRTRLLREVVAAVRSEIGSDLALFVRVSATEWLDDGWTIDDTVALAADLAEMGVDLIDCSSGGIVPDVPIPVGPGYQVPLARDVRARTGVPTAAVGRIVDAAEADSIIRSGAADAVMIGKAMLRNPAWPRRAAHELGSSVTWPKQYEPARPPEGVRYT